MFIVLVFSTDALRLGESRIVFVFKTSLAVQIARQRIEMVLFQVKGNDAMAQQCRTLQKREKKV